jgi:hypothetical protein
MKNEATPRSTASPPASTVIVHTHGTDVDSRTWLDARCAAVCVASQAAKSCGNSSRQRRESSLEATDVLLVTPSTPRDADERRV